MFVIELCDEKFYRCIAYLCPVLLGWLIAAEELIRAIRCVPATLYPPPAPMLLVPAVSLALPAVAR